jgi:hypothetical protein
MAKHGSIFLREGSLTICSLGIVFLLLLTSIAAAQSNGSVSIRVHGPAKLLLTNSAGQRTAAGKELLLSASAGGDDTLQVTGTGTGVYTLEFTGEDTTGALSQTMSSPTPTARGVVHAYTLNLSNGSAPGLSGKLTGNGRDGDANRFLTFANPTRHATLTRSGENNFALIIFYGATTDPTSFTAFLNGKDLHQLFSAAPGTSQTVNLPLPNGESTLNLKIDGRTTEGRIATESETLRFDVRESAPAAPGGVTATATGTTQVELKWTANASSGVTYSVFRSTTRGFTPFAGNLVASGITTASYSDSGLDVFTKYFYVVEAVDRVGVSAASDLAAVRTQLIAAGGPTSSMSSSLIGASISAPTVTGGTVSSITSNFNGTAMAGGDTIWFSSVLQPKNLINAPVTIFVRNSMITFTADGTTYNVPAPDADIVFNPSATTASTIFTGAWQTLAPSKGLAGNTLLDAVEFPVPAGGLPGGIKDVTWTASFSTDTAGVSLQWQWASAVYKSFNTSYDALGVKPVDDNKASVYQNSDHAGTPENYRTDVTGGAMGGGGSNFTGSYSGTTAVNPALVTGGGGGPS